MSTCEARCSRERVRSAEASSSPRSVWPPPSRCGRGRVLGGRDPATVQRIAMSKFRAISLELVAETDMMGNKPHSSLYVKTNAATFNSVDAFVSHSWSDDPSTKWTQLQRWRAQFKRERKREPIVWIDTRSGECARERGGGLPGAAGG